MSLAVKGASSSPLIPMVLNHDLLGLYFNFLFEFVSRVEGQLVCEELGTTLIKPVTSSCRGVR